VALVASASSGGRARSLVAAGVFLLATVAFVGVQVDRQRRRRTASADVARAAYLHYLAGVRTVVRDAAAKQRAASLWQHPDPAALPALAEEGSRVWDRAATGPEFLRVRYGVGCRPLSLTLVMPDLPPTETPDPAAASALHRLVAVQGVQPHLPVTADLRSCARIDLTGPREETRSLARAMVCSAATFQSTADLVVAVLVGEEARPSWEWVAWLPHALSPVRADAAGPCRLVSARLARLSGLLTPDVLDRPPFGTDASPLPHVLLVVDGEPEPDHRLLSDAGLCGVTVLDVAGSRSGRPRAGRLRLDVDDGPGDEPRSVRALLGPGPELPAVADRCGLSTAEALARRLAGWPVGGATTASAATAARDTPPDLAAVLRLGDLRTYDPATAWGTRPARERLRVPLGVGDAGEPVHLDLKESAHHGMGPHGVVIGATGSGKSELLRTLVLGLALTHSPAELNLVLVDFKGGATFAGMAAMPHVSALITNLAQELILVDRMHDALSGEMVRRQERLRASGRDSSHDYEAARAAGAGLAALPSLLVVVDEFTELLAARPEFLELFVAMGRLGRSLGLHLLLASQRLEEGRLRGLESHLSYRIGLRTFTSQESRAVLGSSDAYDLAPEPGLGFLRAGRSALVRFRAAYASGSAPGADARVLTDAVTAHREILPWRVDEVRALEQSRVVPASEPAGREGHPAGPSSALAIAVDRMTGHGPPAHQVWLPPLDLPDTLDRLMPDLTSDADLGLVSRRWRRTPLSVPIGTVDRPRDQRRGTLALDLSGPGGHVAVVGGPRSGRSTLLRTLVTGLALTTTPRESQVFVLDFGGGGFAALAALPHVAGVGTRAEPTVVRRTVAEATALLVRREAFFRDHDIDSVETYRGRRAQGTADDGYGDVFLVVDGWGALHSDFEDLEVDLHGLASRGLTYGVHLLATGARWADFRTAVRDLFGTRLELRLGDPTDSEIGRAPARLVPAGRPGRGLTPEGLHFLTALPRIDGDPDALTLADGTATTVARVVAAWRGPAGPRLRLLPDVLPYVDLLRLAAEDPRLDPALLLGVAEADLAPVGLDPDVEPHWLVFGDGRSGKTSALRAYVHEVLRTRSPERAQLVVVDYRRSLWGEVPDPYLLHHLASAGHATAALGEVADLVRSRLPGPGVPPDQVRSRSWWNGAEVFVVVDDYDLVATPQGSPLLALHPLLAQARDLGLHLVLARRAGGASRALHDPVIQTLRDLATPGLLLSGNPDEGPLLGHVRPSPSPAGRGRMVTRDRGVEVLQVAWREPAW
jgi:S-DNA-T family DNA segregation ATPase FtsK/SpoIIIE